MERSEIQERPLVCSPDCIWASLLQMFKLPCKTLNRNARHWYTQAASCELSAGAVSAERRTCTAAVTSAVE